MPSYRGIVLDSIHPNIKKALDIETAGFERKDGTSYNHITTRTPWMRSVPFVIPTDQDNENVPDWKDFVLYSIQGESIPGMPPAFNRAGFGKSTDGKLYRSDYRNTPVPGITNINVSNKGDLGTIRRATLSIKCYHEKDLEDLEMMYMVPGASILLEWGWFSSNKGEAPIYIGDLQEGGKLSNIPAIQEEILKKTLDVDDLLLSNEINQSTDTAAGLYDGLLGVITKFSWTNASDGTYDVQIDIIAPSSLTLGIPTNTYKLGGKVVDVGAQEVDGEPPLTPINDVELVYYSINRESTKIEIASTKDAIVDNVGNARIDVLRASSETQDSAVEQILASDNGLLALSYDDEASRLGFISYFVEGEELKAEIVENDPGQIVLGQKVYNQSGNQGPKARSGITVLGSDGKQIYSNPGKTFGGKDPQEVIQNIVNAAISEYKDERTAAVDYQEENNIEIANSLQYTLQNSATAPFTWGTPSFHLYKSQGNTPIMTCDVGMGATGITRDQEISFKNEEYNEMGISLYGETYVSWRFIEENIINELFMPRLEASGSDTTPKLVAKFLSMYPQVVEESEDDESLKMYESVKIMNSEWLRSLDPTICIIPGQEMTLSNDGTSTLLPYAAPIKSIDSVFTVDDSFNEGYLRNILVNINVVRDASTNSTSVNDFAMEILSQVSEACGNPWSFKVITNSALQQIMVIDENVGGDYRGYKQAVDRNSPDIYKFSGVGTNNICRDVKIQTKLPNEVQALAYYAMSGASPTISQDINMFKLYGTGLQDRLKPRIVSDNEIDRRNTETENLWESYGDLLKRTRIELASGLGTTKGYREGINIAVKFVSTYIHDTSEKNPAYSPPIPIDISLTLNGISGVYMGNAIMLKTIDEGGMIPNRYKDIVALQATSVDQNISPQGWTTSINTLMRPISSLPAPDIKERDKPSPLPPEARTGTITADVMKMVEADLADMKSYLNHTGIPYINGSSFASQTYYKIRGSQSKGYFNTSNDDEEFFSQKILPALIAMTSEARSNGITLTVNDGWRSQEKQEYLYNGWIAWKKGESQERFYPTDQPGFAPQQDGSSISFSTQDSSHYKWLVNNAHKFGFRREFENEKWLWSFRPDQLIYGKVINTHESWDGEEAVI